MVGKRQPEAFWPDNARCCVLLTFDVDGEAIWRSAYPEQADHVQMVSLGRYGTKRGIWRVLDALDRFEMPATFFYPGWVAENNPQQVEALVERGHELGLHGYLHENFGKLTVDEQRVVLDRGLKALEPFTAGGRVDGFRTIGNPRLETVRLSIEYGFRYSSMMMDDDRPYRWVLDGKETDFVEIPFRIELDDMPFFVRYGSVVGPNAPPRICKNADVLDIWIDAFDAYYEFGLCYQICFHPQVIGFPPRVLMFEKLLDHIRQHDDVWITTCREMADYWRGYRPAA